MPGSLSFSAKPIQLKKKYRATCGHLMVRATSRWSVSSELLLPFSGKLVASFSRRFLSGVSDSACAALRPCPLVNAATWAGQGVYASKCDTEQEQH